MIQFWYSLRFSMRMLAARPVMALLAIITMGIGIGVTTSQLMIFQGLMYPRLPLPEAERIAAVTTRDDGKTKHGMVHSHLIRYWQHHQKLFDSFFSYSEGTVNVFHQNRAIRYSGSWVDAGFFEALGVKPILGEGFQPGDDELEMQPKAVLGYDAWVHDFGSDPSIIGREILVNSESTMVVGVMPEGFKFPIDSNIWIPDRFYPGLLIGYDANPAAYVAVRTREGIPVEQAAQELNQLKQTFLSQVSADFRERFEASSEVALVPFVEAMTDTETRNILYLSSSVVLLVLLIACANVTNLLLAGLATRMKEMAIRCALGASKRDIASQVWVESLLITLAGALLGLIYCMWATDWGNAQLTAMDAPFWYQLKFTPSLLGMILLVTMAASVLAAALPVLRMRRLAINQVLQDDSRTGTSLSIGATNKTLVVLQISISCALLIVAGMMIKQLHVIRNVDLGFDPQSVLAARMGLLEGKFKGIHSRAEFAEKLLTVLESQGEIASAAITTRMQLIHTNWDIQIRFSDAEGGYLGEGIPVYSEGISDHFFETLGVKVVEGSMFRMDPDVSGRLREVVITEPLAAAHFPEGNAVGNYLEIVQDVGPNAGVERFKIVGVVEHTFMRGGIFDTSGRGGVHFHYRSIPHRFLTVVIRPEQGYHPYSLVPLLKRCVAEVDPEIPLYFVETPYDSIRSEFAGLRFAADLFVMFSAVALLLSFIGIFGITTFSILERIQEIGIRKALGATGGEVFQMILRKGVMELVVGLVLGSLAGMSLSIALKSVFPRSGLVDPMVYFAVVLILTASSLLACLYPARKAALIQPAEATRVN